jgi:hypothetical protein
MPTLTGKFSAFIYSIKSNSYIASWPSGLITRKRLRRSSLAPKKNKWAKVCGVKHAFTLDELKEDPEAYFDIKDDTAEKAEKHGEFTLDWPNSKYMDFQRSPSPCSDQHLSC